MSNETTDSKVPCEGNERMSGQEIFNKVWDWFVVQGNPRSVNEEGDCNYRGPNNSRCAVGLLISDACYRPSMEGHTARTLSDEYPQIIEAIAPTDLTEGVKFLMGLQACHDNSSSYVSTAQRLRAFAETWSLSVPNSEEDFSTSPEPQVSSDHGSVTPEGEGL